MSQWFFNKDLLLARNFVFFKEKTETSRSSNSSSVCYFSLNFCAWVVRSNTKNLCTVFFVLFRIYQEKLENLVSFHGFLKIYRFRKSNILFTIFVGISKKKKCTKFQRKTIISPEFDLLEILIFVDKRTSFW